MSDIQVLGNIAHFKVRNACLLSVIQELMSWLKGGKKKHTSVVSLAHRACRCGLGDDVLSSHVSSEWQCRRNSVNSNVDPHPGGCENKIKCTSCLRTSYGVSQLSKLDVAPRMQSAGSKVVIETCTAGHGLVLVPRVDLPIVLFYLFRYVA